MVSREFFVLDENNHASLDNNFAAEAFTTQRAALVRARQLAKSEAGHTVVVAEAIAYVTSEVPPPIVTFRERKLKGNGNGRPRRKAARREQADHR
jgi:hypothetical protein